MSKIRTRTHVGVSNTTPPAAELIRCPGRFPEPRIELTSRIGPKGAGFSLSLYLTGDQARALTRRLLRLADALDKET